MDPLHPLKTKNRLSHQTKMVYLSRILGLIKAILVDNGYAIKIQHKAHKKGK